MFSILVNHRECTFFLYREFNIVYLFLPEVCDSLFWVYFTFPAKVFFLTLSGQREYNYFLLYFRNHVFANVDGFGSKKRHKRNTSSRDLHSSFSYKGAITQDTKIFVDCYTLRHSSTRSYFGFLPFEIHPIKHFRAYPSFISFVIFL